MSAKKTIKGLAMGAVLAGVATLAIKMREEKNQKKAKEMAKHAQMVTAKVVKHAQKLGKLTKTAYNQIVNTTICEYKEVKALSESELKELQSELKESWSDVQNIMRNEAPTKKAPRKKARK